MRVRAPAVLPVTDDYDGGKLVTRVDGRRVVTPLFLVLLAIGSTDLLFALDSIPAVFGVTEEPYIVFAANAFALLGLRALFFLVTGLLDRLVYLHRPGADPGLHRRQADPALPARRRVDGDTRNPYPAVPGGHPRRAGHDRDGEPAAARTHPQQRAHAGALRAHGDHAKPGGDSTRTAPLATRLGPDRDVGSPGRGDYT